MVSVRKNERVPQLRIALAQLNPTVGDLTGNADLIVDAVRQAAAAGAHVVVCSEMALTGYPVEDLALRQTFTSAARQALTDLAARLDSEGTGDVLTVVGYLDDQDGPRKIGRAHG